MKRNVSWLVALVLILCICPLPVSANSPAPSPWYTFEIQNYPKGTMYVDILIQLPESDPNYVELVTENVPAGFSEDAEIIRFCENDFRSYTFHYRGAQSSIRLGSKNYVTIFTDSSRIYDADTYDHLEDVEQRGMVRIAMLNPEGNILQISKPLSIRPSGLFSYSLGRFSYDAEQDELIVESHSNGLIVFLFAVVGLLGILWTCWVEYLVARLFIGIKEHTGLILVTNLVSQLLMRIAQILLLGLCGRLGLLLSYIPLVLALEAVVYLCEYLFYHKMMPDVSWQRCLVYTVCANTVSAVSGLILMSIFII